MKPLPALRSIATLTFAVASVGLVAPARAATGAEVDATGKGLVGGTLLGVEAVDIGLALGGVESSWPYWALGGVGAVGGGWLGYTLEQTASASTSMYMLVAGVGLVIPTVILSLDATAYHPPEGDTNVARNTLRPPGAMVGLEPGALRLGVPVPEVRPLYTAQERAAYGIAQRSEVHVPLLQGSF